ncbi:hypothetical protein [Profundibacter sp.]
MQLRTTQEEFGPYPFWQPSAHIVVTPNGGSVLIEVNNGVGWQEIALYNNNDTLDLTLENGHFRITPSPGATYIFETR